MLSTAVAVANRHTAFAATAALAIVAKRSKSYHAPLRDVRFLLEDVLDFESHYKKLPGVEAPAPDTMNSLLEAAGKFSESVLFPLMEVADKEGCKLIDEHTVKTPTGYKDAYDKYIEGQWLGVSYPEKYGGLGMPPSLSVIVGELLATSNFTWSMFPGLSRGCINTLLAHGSDALKDKYLPDLIAGNVTGTMCLTEPQCGSDLAQVRTKATPADNGTFRISGTKLFISCGEHDLTENVMHCVLARLPDAPPGTKGISLFLVPKRLIDDHGNVGSYNKVNIGRIEDKMGCHGSPTCEINFDGAVGFLIGEENRGLNHMFTFINTSRIGTAVQGIGAAELSFQNALEYAKERLSMRSLTGIKCPDKPADPLIVHPDIRRMLLTQKAIAEGGRAMLYHCAMLDDVQHAAAESGNSKLAKEMEDRLGFLTPILKGFLTEMGVEAANHGIQVWGGHGYIKENMMEQILRNVRIAPVWEGTTGIQALDLLGRKLMQNKLRPLNQFVKEINKACYSVLKEKDQVRISRHAWTLLKRTYQWRYLTWYIAVGARNNKDFIGSASVDYLMYSGYITMGYFWLLQAQAATRKIKTAQGPEADFYKAKIQMTDFYFDRIIPRTVSLATLLKVPPTSLMAMDPDHMASYM